jgi:hypothetical protein
MDDSWCGTSRWDESDAHYQAGHALVALRESLDVVRIYMEDSGSSWIDVRYPDLNASRSSRSVSARSNAKAAIRALLAGPTAEARYSFGTLSLDCPLPDFDLTNSSMIENEAVWQAISLASRISSDSPSLIRSSWRHVQRLIHGDEIWPAIEAVAKALLMNGELAGCEVKEIARYATSPRARTL